MVKEPLPEIQGRFDESPPFLKTTKGKIAAAVVVVALGGGAAKALIEASSPGVEPRQASPTVSMTPELTPTARQPVTAAAPEESQEPMEGGVQPGAAAEATPSPMPSPTPSPSPEAAASEAVPVEPVTEEPEPIPPSPTLPPTVTLPPSPSATASATRRPPPPTATSTEVPRPTAPPTPSPMPTETPPPPVPEQEQTPLGYFFQETGIAFEEPAWAQVKFSDILIKTDTLANVQEIIRRIKENGGLIDTAGGGGGVAFKHKDGKVYHRSAYHSAAHNAEGIFVKYENGRYLVIGPDNTVLNDEAMTDVFYFFRGDVPGDFASEVEELIQKKMESSALNQPKPMTFTREELGFGPKPISRADALASRRAHQAELARNRRQIKQPLAQQTIGGGFRVKV